MILLCFISFFVLGAVIGYITYQENRQVAEYCQTVIDSSSINKHGDPFRNGL